MSEKYDKEHMIQALKEMVQEKEPNEPIEKILAVFCERYGLSAATCNMYYKQLVDSGAIKK